LGRFMGASISKVLCCMDAYLYCFSRTGEIYLQFDGRNF
jgi:hypothetical protein